MGSFSWNKADELTQVENVACGSSFKFLIPKEFGGGFIKDKYQDYGHLGLDKDGEPKYDMYELLAFWNNAEGLKYNGEKPLMKEIDEYTNDNYLLCQHEHCCNSGHANYKPSIMCIFDSFNCLNACISA